MAVGLVFLSIHTLKQRFARRRQIRTALHLLSASGVLRPSHVELRSTAPLSCKRLGQERLPHYSARRAASHRSYLSADRAA